MSDPRELDIRECREWIANYEQDMFNISCQRCGMPFKDGHNAIAAPAEWFGVIDWLREACDEIARLRLDAGDYPEES